MPRGMYLKSQGFASNLSDPDGSHTLEAFCRKTGHPYASYGLPVPHRHVHQLRPVVRRRAGARPGRGPGDRGRPAPRGFAVGLADRRDAGPGTWSWRRRPEWSTSPGCRRVLTGLPTAVCTHASAHDDLSVFAGQRVVVVGGGQAALESAALLHEQGAQTEVVARAGRIRWNGEPLDPERPLPQRMREPESGLGSGWSTWFYSPIRSCSGACPSAPGSSGPGPRWARPGPAGCATAWRGQFPMRVGHALRSATPVRGMASGSAWPSATGRRWSWKPTTCWRAPGYRPDLTRLSFLDPALSAQVGTVDASRTAGCRAQLPVRRARPVHRGARGGAQLRARHAVRLRQRARGHRGRPRAGWIGPRRDPAAAVLAGR